MTDEDILELAKNCEFDFSIKWRHKGGESSNQMYWKCWEEQLLKFARALYAEGFKVGVEYGYDEGWDSSNVSTKMNTWSSYDD